MTLISTIGEYHVFDPIKKRKENTMKEYEVTLVQEVEGTIVVKASNKTEAKEVVEELINDSKIQHLINFERCEDDLLNCDDWKVQSVEDY